MQPCILLKQSCKISRCSSARTCSIGALCAQRPLEKNASETCQQISAPCTSVHLRAIHLSPPRVCALQPRPLHPPAYVLSASEGSEARAAAQGKWKSECMRFTAIFSIIDTSPAADATVRLPKAINKISCVFGAHLLHQSSSRATPLTKFLQLEPANTSQLRVPCCQS